MKFLKWLRGLFRIDCPNCSKSLSRPHAEDPWMDGYYKCYYCGMDFIEGGDGLE